MFRTILLVALVLRPVLGAAPTVNQIADKELAADFAVFTSGLSFKGEYQVQINFEATETSDRKLKLSRLDKPVEARFAVDFIRCGDEIKLTYVPVKVDDRLAGNLFHRGGTVYFGAKDALIKQNGTDPYILDKNKSLNNFETTPECLLVNLFDIYTNFLCSDCRPDQWRRGPDFRSTVTIASDDPITPVELENVAAGDRTSVTWRRENANAPVDESLAFKYIRTYSASQGNRPVRVVRVNRGRIVQELRVDWKAVRTPNGDAWAPLNLSWFSFAGEGADRTVDQKLELRLNPDAILVGSQVQRASVARPDTKSKGAQVVDVSTKLPPGQVTPIRPLVKQAVDRWNWLASTTAGLIVLIISIKLYQRKDQTR